jgi:hypothetical protein
MRFRQFGGNAPIKLKCRGKATLRQHVFSGDPVLSKSNKNIKLHTAAWSSHTSR